MSQHEIRQAIGDRQELPIACRSDAFTPAEHGHYRQIRRQMREALREIRELADGYGFGFPAEPDVALLVLEFVTLERRCCPFLRFELEVEPEGGALWLRLTGDEGVKQFLQAELRLT